MMQNFDSIERYKNKPSVIKFILSQLKARNSPHWSQQYIKEQQLIAYCRYILMTQPDIKIIMKMKLLALLDTDHELSRKIYDSI